VSDRPNLKDLLPSLKLDEYISFDLETTGLNPKTDRITEIAACRFKNGEFVDEFTTLVNPEKKIPKHITAITGITNKMVEDAPLIGDVMPDFLKFIGETALVAQNINFDYTFINNNLSETDGALKQNKLYDTLPLARAFIYFHNSFSLGSLCDYFNIEIDGAHRARADAFSTGKLFLHLVQEVLSKPLTLIQRIDELFSNENVYNVDLFSNVIKTSIKHNIIDGLLKSNSKNTLSESFYSYKTSGKSDMPSIPKEWFSDEGPICLKWKGFERRSSQTELIKDSYEAFSNGDILVAEAGTGLGKSLSYLSSGFLASKKSNKALVISTYTKNLQGQLFNEDIPQFSEVIDQDLSAVIYKGRDNYICKTRFHSLLQNNKNLLKPYEYEHLLPLLVWEWETRSGDINECNGFKVSRHRKIWSLVRSDRGFCTTSRCNKYDGCFLGKVRMKIEDADIIIINHSLFANELIKDSPSLPEDFIYVIDEAHHFATVTRDQLVTQVGTKSFDDVFHFFSLKQENWRRNAINRFPEILELYNRLSSDSRTLKSNVEHFFNSYYRTKHDIISKSDYNVSKMLYQNSEKEFIDTDPSPWDILHDLNRYEIDVQKFGDLIQENKEDISQSISMEFSAINSILKEGVKSLKCSLEVQSDLVQWTSFTQSDYQNLTELNSAPLKVNSFIHDSLLSQYSGGLFCSATLMINEDFRYFNEKVGLDLAVIDQNVVEKVYHSPFHYSDQVKLFVFRSNIDVKDSLYINEIGSQIERIFTSLEKRMLVLCTSYKQTAALKYYLEPKLKEKDFKVFTQAPGVSRNVLVSGYLENPKSILIGTSSFWEGVDFPGDKVEILFIVKAPFDNPFDPLVQAQIEDFRNRGDDPFMDYQVPEAAMKFRQGFGRLIRNMDDSGICVVGDTRLYKRGYGKIILESLPVEAVPYQTVESLLYQSQNFF
jgi:predicted DnaQ family exonuclease/DinG family helicase